METLPPILQSKKFLAAALASLISFLGVREGFTPEQIGIIIGPIVAFITVQGITDFGKERAKVEAESERQARIHSTTTNGNKPS